MGIESPPFQWTLPLEPPEPPKAGAVESFVTLSPEEHSALLQGLKNMDKEMLMAWYRRDGKRDVIQDAFRLLKMKLDKDPEFLERGLHYPETRSYALSIINTTNSFLRMDQEKNHFSERESFSPGARLAHKINTTVLSAQAELESELADEKSTDREEILSIWSTLLDSDIAEQRELGKAMLLKHLPLLQELLYAEFDDGGNGETHMATAWQGLLLRMEKADDFLKVFSALRNVWQVKKDKSWSAFYQKLFQPALAVKSKPLEQNQDFITRAAIDLAGLDGSTLIDSWTQAGDESLAKIHGPSHQYAYEKNLKALYDLKQVSPEAPKELHERFGITHFGRYDKKMLQRQYEERESQVPYGIVIYPEADRNGAFFQNSSQLAQACLKLLMGGLETRIVEAGSQKELARRLSRMHKKYSLAGHKFAFAIVAGHGSKNSIALGNDRMPSPPPLPDSEKSREEYEKELEIWRTSKPTDAGSFVSDDLLAGKGINRALEEWFEKDAPKVLISCSTGVEGGIAERVSAQTSGEVTAPEIPTNVKKIEVTFDEKGRPKFSVEYHGSNTARYVAGKLKEEK